MYFIDINNAEKNSKLPISTSGTLWGFPPVLLSCTERVTSSLHQNSLPPYFSILSSMKSRLTDDDILNHYAVRTDPDNLIVRNNLDGQLLC